MGATRADIKTGYVCNNNCLFCVQAHRKSLGNRSICDILKDLSAAKDAGCRDIVFTGGEVTIRSDIFELVSHARKLGFETIQIQSNSRMMSSMSFCRKLIDAGANEFGPALHGHIPELHDYLTRAPGSFRQTLKAISNLKRLSQRIITNTVVVKPNYRHLPDIALLLSKMRVEQFQFAFMHAVGNALTNYGQMMPYVSLAAPYIKKGLQIGIDSGIKVMAEAMTPCTIRGYEKYCSEHYIPMTEIRDGRNYDPDFTVTRKQQGKAKFEQCRRCIYDASCEGPWREYPERRGSEEFQPIERL